MAILTFEERNKDKYIKFSDVPKNIINKYKEIFPNDLIIIWEKMGFGIFEDGFFQLVNPDEYEFVFKYIDKLYEPSVIWAVTALGDLIMWEGNKNVTIKNAGNCNTFINVRKCNDHVIGADMEGFLNYFLGDRDYWPDNDYFAAKPYLQIKGKISPLEYGQCYGYVPAIALGGNATIKNIKIVDIKSYINIIGNAVGKIVAIEK
jgi:hypothetical protein